MAGSLGEIAVRLVGDNASFDASIDKSQRKFEAFSKKLGDFGKKMSTYVTLPLVGIGVAAVRSTANMEDLSAAFETMLGSADEAAKMLANLTEFAARTPFQLTDLANSTKTLLAFGIASEDIMPTVSMLGDIAQGNTEKFRMLTLAYSQVQSAGRLMGQDLMQMINTGFNPLSVIAEQTGESMLELKTRMEQGGISAQEVAGAFKIATSEGGMFFGGMERASKTFNGLISTLKDNISLLGREFGEVLLPALKDATQGTTDFVQKLQGMDDFHKHLILNLGKTAALLGPVAFGVNLATKAFVGLKAVLAAAGGPVTLVIAVVTALAAVVAVLHAIGRAREEAEFDTIREDLDEISLSADVSSKTLRKVQNGLVLAASYGQDAAGAARILAHDLGLSLEQVIAIGQRSSDVTDEYKEQLGALLEQLDLDKNRLTIDEQRMEQQRMRSVVTEAQLETEENITEEIREQQRLAGLGYSEQQISNIEKRRLATQAYNDELTITQRRLDAGLISEQDALNRNITSAEGFRTALADIGYTAEEGGQAGQDSFIAAGQAIDEAKLKLQEYNEYVRYSSADMAEARRIAKEDDDAAIEDTRQKAIKRWQDELSIAQSVISQLSAISSAFFANESQSISNRERQEQQRIENSLMSEEEKAAALEELDNEIDRKRRLLARKEAIANKAFAVFDIGIKTAMGIMGALAMLPPRPVLATAIGIMGAAQLAATLATPLPALAQGGIVTPSTGGTAVTVAEAGQAEVIFPLDKLDQFLSDRSMAGGGSGTSDGDIHISVMMDSKPFLDKIFPATRNRQILIDARAVV